MFFSFFYFMKILKRKCSIEIRYEIFAKNLDIMKSYVTLHEIDIFLYLIITPFKLL